MTAVNAVGFLCTFMVPETKNKTLEEIASDGLTDDGYTAGEADTTNDGGEKELELQRPSMINEPLKGRSDSGTQLVKVG